LERIERGEPEAEDCGVGTGLNKQRRGDDEREDATKASTVKMSGEESEQWH
jgi:hypothetical protein